MKYLQFDNTFDVIAPRWIDEYDSFFGPIRPGTEPLVQDFDRTSEVLVALGLVDSKGWCRKNGWDKPLQEGYQEITFGKLKYRICILR
jgi:hypothetical protein